MFICDFSDATKKECDTNIEAVFLHDWLVFVTIAVNNYINIKNAFYLIAHFLDL
jgi:hypothetical protein